MFHFLCSSLLWIHSAFFYKAQPVHYWYYLFNKVHNFIKTTHLHANAILIVFYTLFILSLSEFFILPLLPNAFSRETAGLRVWCTMFLSLSPVLYTSNTTVHTHEMAVITVKSLIQLGAFCLQARWSVRIVLMGCCCWYALLLYSAISTCCWGSIFAVPTKSNRRHASWVYGRIWACHVLRIFVLYKKSCVEIYA